jgi:hypothetical protein
MGTAQTQHPPIWRKSTWDQLLVVLVLWTVMATACLPGRSACAQEDRNRYNLLLLPSSREAMKSLQKSCRLWTQQPLRSAIQDISQQYGVPIWLDRQIDPTQIVRLGQAEQDATVAEELSRLASGTGNCGGLVENVYLIAPPDRLARIQRAAVVLHGQLASSYPELGGTQKALIWPDITSSNEIIELIQQEWGVKIEYELPHDLFYAAELPRSSLATQLSLLLGGFELQAKMARDKPDVESISAGTETVQPGPIDLNVLPLSADHLWQDIYSESLYSGKLTAQHRGQLEHRYPGSKIRELPDRRLAVLAETNVHGEILSMPFSAARARSTGNGRQPAKKYSFRVEELLPVEAVLSNLAQSFAMQIEWSEDSTPAHRNRLIQLRVENVSQQELLQEVCNQASLRLDVRGDKIIVSPMESN